MMVVSAYIPITNNNTYSASSEKEIIIMEEAIPVDLPVAACSDAAMNNSDLCSYVAAGNCRWDPAATGFRIIFCDEHVEYHPIDHKAENVTVITYPCEAG